MVTKWERMWGYRDSQEVGLEAAILERVRNSSLVKWSCAEYNGAQVTHRSYGCWSFVQSPRSEVKRCRLEGGEG